MDKLNIEWAHIEGQIRAELYWQQWYLERFYDFRGRLVNEYLIQCYEQRLARIEIKMLRAV